MAIISGRGGGGGTDIPTRRGGTATGGRSGRSTSKAERAVSKAVNESPTGRFREASGQRSTGSGGGSQALASGGDPFGASVTVRPGARSTNLRTAERLAVSAVRTSPDPEGVLSRIKNRSTFGGGGDGQAAGAETGDVSALDQAAAAAENVAGSIPGVGGGGASGTAAGGGGGNGGLSDGETIALVGVAAAGLYGLSRAGVL